MSQRGYEAEYRLSLQRAAEAERLYLEALRRNPRDLEALYGLGCVYALTGDFRRAVEIWSRCIETRPDWGEVHIALAWAYYRLGDRDRGFRFVESALKLGVRIKSERELLTRFREMAEKPLINLILEEEEPKEHLIFNKTAIVGLIFVFFFALYTYSPILYGFPKGGDAPNALSMIRYLEKWWPHFPRWNTEWGCGYPFLTFYQPLGIVSTFLLSKAFSLSIFIAYKLMMLLLVVFSSLGLYIFSLLLFEDKVAALTAAILYLYTPGSFNNLIYWGFYIEHFGYPFLIVTMLLLHLYMKTCKKRFLTASIVTYVLLLLSHSLMAVLGSIVLFTYFLWLHLKERASFTRFIKSSLLFFGFSLSLVAFWYAPFISLGAFKQYVVLSPKTWGPLSLEQLIGLPGSGFTRLAPWTSLLGFVGGLICLKRKINRFFLFWSLIFIFYLEANRFSIFYPLYDGVVFPQRFLPWTSIFLSLLGGQTVKFVKTQISSWRIFILLSLIFVISFPIAHIHRIEISSATHHSGTYELMNELSYVVKGRIAFTGYMGQFVQTFNLASEESQLHNYQWQSAPNLAWIGMADAYLFKGFGGVDEAVMVSRWYGLDYIFIDDASDVAQIYASPRFKEIWSERDYRLVRVVDSAPYVSLGNRRRILVIGDRYAYENIFWALIHSNFDPEESALVWSNKRVERHDIDELQLFDIVILYGYSYRDRERAFRLLEEYVKRGGSLLIDTGYSPDSDAKELPPPFPIMRVMAGDFGFTWSFSPSSSRIVDKVNFSAFSPPHYGEAPWGVSYSFNTTLRPWAEPLLWLYGHPIVVAGEFGRGRVVWCGLNLPYHAKSYRNREEAELLLCLLNWLSPPRDKSSTEVEVDRPIPEKMIIPISGDVKRGASVFVRETYFPKWHAYLEVGGERRKLDLYYSGPGFMLVILPEEIDTPARLILRYETIRIEYIGYIITIASIILLIIYAVKNIVRRDRNERVKEKI